MLVQVQTINASFYINNIMNINTLHSQKLLILLISKTLYDKSQT